MMWHNQPPNSPIEQDIRDRIVRALDRGDVVSFFQPMQNLKTGEIVGFEALARLDLDGHILPPAHFLPVLNGDERFDLFCIMLSKVGSFMQQTDIEKPGNGFFVSINLESSIIIRDAFPDTFRSLLAQRGIDPNRLTLEILESEEIHDLAKMRASLTTIRRTGVAIAIDDIGSGYSSLKTIKDLPVDVIKLDQDFVRNLHRQPEDLLFVLSIQSLARGLGKRLIVEGVETAEVREALTILGVELAQGYAIQRPMPGDHVSAWLSHFQVEVHDGNPRSLLGVYASHLNVVEACRLLVSLPIAVTWNDRSRDPHQCKLGVFFDRHNLHDSYFGLMHKRFHEVISDYAQDREAWERGAEAFSKALVVAICEAHNTDAAARALEAKIDALSRASWSRQRVFLCEAV